MHVTEFRKYVVRVIFIKLSYFVVLKLVMLPLDQPRFVELLLRLRLSIIIFYNYINHFRALIPTKTLLFWNALG